MGARAGGSRTALGALCNRRDELQAINYLLTMRLPLFCATLACAAANAGAQAAVEHGAFVIRLGTDTIGVERFDRMGDSIVGVIINRSPRTRRFEYVARFDREGAATTYTMLLYQSATPGASVAARADVDFRDRDSVRTVITQGGDVRHSSAPNGTVALPVLEPGFAAYEGVVKRALAADGKRVPIAAYYIGADTYRGSVVRSQPGLVVISTSVDTIRCRVDESGRILSATNPGGTLQTVVERVPTLDIDAWAAEAMRRDAQGRSLGALSPRDTVRATVGGAHILIDYGRPLKRGREVFGVVVPLNRVWRTGANAATTLVIDRDVMLGDTKLPAGEYTLFSLPAADAWTLIVSKKTREWGTDYDASADFARIPMRLTAVSQPTERFTISIEPNGSEGGILGFAWDTRVGQLNVRAAQQS
jgi:hypothetical protein